ncbi:MAG: CoA-binding protein [Armatimonadetes bacterium]|nr:CoA-binding protein [Armatimonadota bacterium]
MFQNPGDHEIKDLLARSKTIAVVGLSDKPERDSYRVAQYMQEKGYRIIPVNPRVKEVLGEKAYPSLAAVPGPVDIVNVFRRSEEAAGVVKEALALKPAAVWLQLGVISEEAAALARERGVPLVMDRCLKIEHGRLLGS